MSFFAAIFNSITTKTIYDDSDGQFMFFEKYPHSKSCNRPLSSAELRTRKRETAKANYHTSKKFFDAPHKKV